MDSGYAGIKDFYINEFNPDEWWPAPTTEDTTGTPDYDGAHLSIVKHAVVDPPNTTQIYYQITLINDGNKALSPVYVRYTFPPGVVECNSPNLKPEELASTYANWTLAGLSVGDVTTFSFYLDIIDGCPSELVDCVDVTAGYDSEWITPSYTCKRITASNTSAIKLKWMHVDLWR